MLNETFSVIFKHRADIDNDNAGSSCHFPPRILGYLGPYHDTFSMKSRLYEDDYSHSNWSSLEQDHRGIFNESSKALYICYGGKVTNTMTNTRHVTLHCVNGEFAIPKSLPRCRDPTHCLGPVLTSNFTKPVQPFPFRDLKVGSSIKYQCRQPEDFAFSSCFVDGQFRYSSSFPECSKNPENLKVMCQHDRIYINHPGDYGFITGNCVFCMYQVSQQVLDRNLAKKSLNVTRREKTRESLFSF